MEGTNMSHVKKKMISFFLTSKCNLDCVYCYTNKEGGSHRNQVLPLEFAKLGIDHYIQEYPHIRFFGAGEPTQEFALMKQIYDYAFKRIGSTLITEMQTNGAFDSSTRDWIEAKVDIIWVSFDGPPDIHDKNRPFYKTGNPSSPVIEANVGHIVSQGKGMVGARVTITDDNVHRQKEMVDYFYSLGVCHIWTDPIFPSVGQRPILEGIDSKTPKPLVDMDEYINDFIEAHHYAASKKVFYGSFLSCNFDEESEYHCRACIPAPHLTTDGYISACDMALFGEDQNHMNPLIFGKWDRISKKLVFDSAKITVLQSRNASNMPGCVRCPVQMNCGGYCLGEVINETGDLFGKKSYACKSINKLSKYFSRNFGCYEFLHP